ncbi:Glycoside hydrolase family 3 [Lasiodiplodia theobromae]|uniref:Glycoside hydrolase family 3 n=1 Tax=Lasiodiplodia theobromae TaxID=45133 RepID=UPI0015C3E993|nr:Glycoside hydrolase family 3 [Lasiodiplodia theobromae]KAF4540135.1 Glycoside hydrolase family 3 [Lasiodiplodia theobromae]
MSSHKATDAETSSPSASTAKELVQGLMHLIMETSREMATAPVRCDDDETDNEKHADRIQDLDNRLVSQALEVWLAHNGNIDLRTFFPAQYKESDSATEHHLDANTQPTKGHPKAPAEQPTDTTASSIIGNPSLFPRTNQLVYETTSLYTFYGWLSKTLPRLPPELVLLVAHASLLDGTTSSSSSSASIPAIPSLFSYYLPHLYPYPGPCTAHIPNCRDCCTLVIDDEDPDPRHPPPPPNANQPSARQAARRPPPPCSTSDPSSPPLPHRSPYAPVSAPALRGIWSYAQTASTPIRATNAFAPCSAAASEPEWFAPPPAAGAVGTVYDDEAGVWRCGCRVVLMGYGMGPPLPGGGGGGQQWWTDGKERPGKLLWNAWKRGWECGEVERFDPGCCEDQYDSGEEREWDERQEKGREGKKRAGMRWAGSCERCRRRRVEEGEED